MRYLPYGPQLDGVRHVVVGSAPRAGTALTLSHLPGAPTPPPLRADTNAEIVLNLLRSSRRAGLLDGVEAVSSERLDADTLLGLWALLEPDAALARAALVEDAARAGSFGVYGSSPAAQFVCWVTGYCEELGLTDAAAFAAMLPQVAGVLDRPRDYDLCWIGEYSDVLRADALLNSGAVKIDEYPELDLAVMQTPLRLHDLVRFTATRMFRLLTVRSENTYALEYRLESWVQYVSRRPLPRIDLRPLAARLNLFERNPGRWRADPVDTRTPRLYLDDGDGRPGPSAIDAETVIAEVLDFFRGRSGRGAAPWSPYTAGLPGT